jgi:hypothetical protein
MRIQIEVPDNLEAMSILFVTHDEQGYTLRNSLYNSDMVSELINDAIDSYEEEITKRELESEG